MEQGSTTPLLDFLNDVAADRRKLERFLDREQREALLDEYSVLSADHRRWLLADDVDEIRNAVQAERDEAAAYGAGEFWLTSPLKRPINT